MSNWLSRIKEKKRTAGFTNEQLSDMCGIPQGTLNKILSGVSDDPKLSTLVAFSRAFDVSIDYIAFGHEGALELTEDETELIRRYRTLDEHSRRVIRLECERPSQSSAKILSPARRFDYSSSNSSYSHSAGVRLPIYDLPVSAGHGALLDGSYHDFITVTVGEATQQADFALRVSGDSMEPRFRDGDVILVHEQSSVEEGELGIFICSDGVTQEGFFKRFGGDRLISLNPNYTDIYLDRFRTVLCRGRVIGRLPRQS